MEKIVNTILLNKKEEQKSLIKFLFIIPPNITFDDFVNPPSNISTITKSGKQFGSLITDIPLGVVSLSAYLKKFIDIEVKAIDFNVILNQVESFRFNSFDEFFLDYIKNSKDLIEFSPDYVGISALFTPTYNSILEIAKISKSIYEHSLLLVGGNFPTSMYRELLQESKHIDAVCYGEGEKGLLGLLQSKNKLKYIEESPSWVNHSKLNNPNNNLAHDFIIDLDEIPFLDYDILDLNGYKLNPTSSRYSVKEKHTLSKSFSHYDDKIEVTGGINEIGEISYAMPIMTSRGCPFKCTFCASHAAHGRDMRYNSVSRVIADVALMRDKYKIDGVVIQDDHFMAGKYRPYEIVEKLGNMQFGMFFQNALAIYALDLPFLKLLKKSGVDALVLPVESGSARVLKEIMKKPLRLEIIPRVLKDCREAGIFTDCNIILGMPGETMDDIQEAKKFLKTIYADWFRVFVATPIPGSDFYKQCEAENLFDQSALSANYKRAVVKTDYLTPEDIQRETYLMNIDLNFVNNSNFRLGNYELALQSFMNVINVKYDHAIAHYYIARCNQELNNSEDMEKHDFLASKYASQDLFWSELIKLFAIPIKTLESNY